MATLYVGTVKSNAGLIVRSGPGTNYPIQEVSDVMYDEKIYIYDLELNGSSRWGRVSDDGWICISNGTNTIVEIQNATNQPTSEISMYSNDTSADLSDEADYYTGQIQEPASSASFPTSAVTYNGSQYVTNGTMRLFGLPYQFTPETDPRYETISPLVGREFAEKFFVDGCIAYIIPGKANFLPGVKSSASKRNSANALIGLSSDDLSKLQGINGDGLRFYDFQEDYTSYINYVNMMCRTVAGFLELRDKIQITSKDGKTTRTITPQQMDWKDYRWTQDTYTHAVSTTLSKLKQAVGNQINGLFRELNKTTTAQVSSTSVTLTDSDNGESVDLDQIGQTQNYIPFYIDPSIGGNESAGNSTTETTISQKLREVHSQMNEYGFLLNSASAGTVLETLGDKADSLWGSLTDGLSGFGSFGGIMDKIFSTVNGAKQVITGENIVIPKIYDSSEYNKSYNITVHLRTPYGDKLSVFMDILVPMLHLLALALPKQSTANTYGSPFLIKMYIPGTTTCNLGIVQSISITKNPDGEAWSVDGLPTAVDVELSIEDLYSSLYMSSTTQPRLFASNSSLIEYLGTISGMNLITPKLEKKIEMIISNTVNSIKDIPGNAASLVLDTIEHNFQDLFNL